MHGCKSTIGICKILFQLSSFSCLGQSHQTLSSIFHTGHVIEISFPKYSFFKINCHPILNVLSLFPFIYILLLPCSRSCRASFLHEKGFLLQGGIQLNTGRHLIQKKKEKKMFLSSHPSYIQMNGQLMNKKTQVSGCLHVGVNILQKEATILFPHTVLKQYITFPTNLANQFIFQANEHVLNIIHSIERMY